MSTLQYILNNLNIATAFFNPKAELVYFNKLFLSLWKINEAMLQNKPYIVQFFEILREHGVFPEKDNFRLYCQQIEKIALSHDAYQNKTNFFLPSGKMLSETQIKSTEGLLLLWEDTTDNLDLIHNLTTQKNIYQRLVDKNQSAIIVVASNGLIDNFNSRFLEIFNLNRTIVEAQPHIKDLLNHIELFSSSNEDKATLIGNILSNRSFYKEYSSNNNTLLVNGIALPNSSSFVTFAYQGNQPALDIPYENVIKFHNDLVVDLNSVIGAPLSNILGFANLLQDEYIGQLNIRQKEYLEKIINKAEYINQELNHKIALNEFESVYNLIEAEEVDLNVIIAHILHHLKAKISAKKITISLNLAKELKSILSIEELINKALVLISNYIVEQNNHNSEIIIDILQNKQQTIFIFKDSSKLPLFSQYDLQNRYDLRLALQSLTKLKATFEHFSKNRNYRTLKIFFYNGNK